MNGSNHTISPKCGCRPFKVGDLLIYRETDLRGNTVIHNGNVVIHCYNCSDSYEMDADTLLNLIGVLDKELNHARPIRRFWRWCLYKCELSCRKLIEKIEHSGVICALRGNHRWCMTHEYDICFNCRKVNYGTEIQT